MALWGSRYGRALLLAASAYMAVTAYLRLRFAFRALTTLPFGAHDLRYRYDEVTRWFAGLPVYGAIANADYPPAAYVTLWPLLGWGPVESARWLWAVTAAVSLAVVAGITAREATRDATVGSGAERLFLALLLFPMYATQMTIWVGQLGGHVLALLLAGILVLHRGSGRLWEDGMAAVLIVLALVKPSISVPFLWLVLFRPGRLRPIALVVAGYVALTVLAAVPRVEGVFALVVEWLSGRTGVMPVGSGHANVHKWLAIAGLHGWMLAASALIALVLGVWTWRRRDIDIWVALGVVALVSRLWFHHWAYDDLLLLLPMIALYRMATPDALADGGNVIVAGSVFVALWVISLLPYRYFEFDTMPDQLISWVVEIVQSTVWLVALAVLLHEAERLHRARGSLASHGDVPAESAALGAR